MKTYETVIGLEVHVELATKTKIFCNCSTAFGGEKNSHTCPVCLGMPGTLPVLNRAVLEKAIGVGLATNCEISEVTRFDRKNYFYPDNPQNYQISQLYAPICKNGWVEIDNPEKKKIRIHEIHMEEDAGKLIHAMSGKSLVDYNRAGVPLIEIVSEPDMRNAQEVIAYLEKLRILIQYLGASDCKLQEGSMRADVNLSVRPAGRAEYGTRTEMKNLGSFRSITKAIESERDRQIAILESGQEVLQETRRWDEDLNQSFSMRSKEDARDYRYFPDPDLPQIFVPKEMIEEVQKKQPEFREAKIQRYKEEYGLPEYDIYILTETKQMADFFEEATRLTGEPKMVSNWLMGETLRLLKEHTMDASDIRFTPKQLAALIELVKKKEITGTVAKEVFEKMFESGIEPKEYVEQQGLLTVRDETKLQNVVQQIISENEKSVQDYLAGKEKAIGFLVGQTMKCMNGQADASYVKILLEERLKEYRNSLKP